MKQQQQGGALFYSYHSLDDGLCQQLARALRPLVREAHLSEWAEYQLPPGTDIVRARRQGWKEATLILLLVSLDYLASETCYQEMLDALERQQQGEVHVLPILMRPCDWSGSPLATVRCLPDNGQAVTTWDNQEQAFWVITQNIRQVVGLPSLAVTPHHVPFMCRNLPPDFVPRPDEFDALIRRLLDEKREAPAAALRGAGGYGKTTMAQALCHDERVRQAFDDGILWVTLGEHPSNLVGKVEDLIYMLSHERPDLTSIDAAEARLAELLTDRDILLVIDDVWDQAHLKPFLQGGIRCARLITTRNERVLPANAQPIPVDVMRQNEAVQLLGYGLGSVQRTPGDEQALQALAARLGEWALLLKLVNGVLRAHVNTYHQPLPDALAYCHKALEKRGLTVFDDRDAQDRSRAVAKTLQVSFEHLQTDEYTRYKDLAIFPEDVDIPLATLHTLWSVTGGLDEFDTEELCI